MSYVNAETVLPKALIQEIQRYVDGQLIYIPRKDENTLSWGEKSGLKEKMAERNQEILYHYHLGKSIPQISEMYYLSEKRVQSIIRNYESSKQKVQGLEEKALKKNIIIRKEEPKDYKETEFMTMRAFWNIHSPGCNEHLLVRKIRKSEDYIPELSRVAELDGKIVGAIYYTKAKVVEDNVIHDIITFGPLAVEPTLFGMGIGKALLEETIEFAQKAGCLGIALAGEPHYYPKVGFQTCDHYGISDANGDNYDALMCLPLQDGFLSVHGRLVESQVYESCDKEEELEQIAKEFPEYTKIKIKDGFLQIFEKHFGVIENIADNMYQIRFWDLVIPAYVSLEMQEVPKLGDIVLFSWKQGENAEITEVCHNML